MGVTRLSSVKNKHSNVCKRVGLLLGKVATPKGEMVPGNNAVRRGRPASAANGYHTLYELGTLKAAEVPAITRSPTNYSIIRNPAPRGGGIALAVRCRQAGHRGSQSAPITIIISIIPTLRRYLTCFPTRRSAYWHVYWF